MKSKIHPYKTKVRKAIRQFLPALLLITCHLSLSTLRAQESLPQDPEFPTGPPITPGNLKVLVTADTAVLTWVSGNAIEYELQYQLLPSGNKVAVLASEPGYVLSSLPPGTYSWKVNASNGNKMTPFVQGPSFTIVAPPTAPFGLQASVSGTSVSFNWSSASQASQYILQYKISFSDSWITAAGLTIPGYSVPSLSQGTYQWRVLAGNAGGNSPYIDGPDFTINLPVPPPVPISSQNENYIKSTEYLTENGEGGNKKTSILYFDGLGREKQAVQVAATPQGKDLITHYEYDGFGRQPKDYLPVPSNGSQGSIITDPISLYNQYYGNAQTYNTQYYYSEKEIENSPLSRVLKQAAPGDSWRLGAGHEVKIQYQTNTTGEVRLFKVNLASGYEPSLSESGSYSAGQLYKTVTKNENWISSDGKNNTTEEFKDKEGKVVLKRTYNNGQSHDTYYVYDIYGNLTYVLPPLLSDKPAVIQTLLDDLGYQYKYDYRNRLVEKKLPGKGWEYMVYDKQDRLVLAQDANQKGKQWNFSKYDMFGRVVYSGLFANTATRASMQTAINSMNINANNNEQRTTSPFTLNNINVYYTKTAFPTGSMTITGINYYDNYENTNTPQTSSVEGQEILQGTGTSLKGLPTVSFAGILGNTQGAGNWTHTLYDTKARPVRVLTQNYLGGFTQTDTKLDYFRGTAQHTITKHSRATLSPSGTEGITIREAFTYDNQERLLTHTHQLNGGNVEYLTQNVYDELGQLKNKKVGGQTPEGLQQIDYQYNIRGWMTDINDLNNLNPQGQPGDLFTFRIGYDKLFDSIYGQIKPLYNGNISETYWRTSTDNILREYSYVYDHLNRLTDAFYNKPESTNPFPGNYNTRFIKYDKNGNILQMKRYGTNDLSLTLIDQMYYTYKSNSNQLLSVQDDENHPSGFNDGNKTGNDYAYDSNGNMTKDLNKNITSITYNHLNLPTKITFGNGNYIEYLYDASGVKMKKTVSNSCGNPETDYLGGFQYLTKPDLCGRPPKDIVGQLQFFPTAEGYIKAETGIKGGLMYSYVYNYTDHLGNIRLSYTQNKVTGNLDILEENNYYPFGLKHEGYANNNLQPDYKYKYNGKELQDELNLNVYDYGARNYDPALGRWFNIDPLAEKYPAYSPYAYTFNNPINFVDPTGMEGVGVDDWYKNKQTGEYIWVDTEPNVTTIVAGHSYIGASIDDVRQDWQENTTAIERAFTNPKINAAGYPGEIMAYNSDHISTLSKWSNSDSFLGQFAYNYVDSWYTTFQFATLDTFKSDTYSISDSKYLHLDGTRLNDSGEITLNIVSTLLPFLKAETSVGSTFGKLSASEYSTITKGTALNKGLTAQERGAVNKGINWGIEKVNQQLAPQKLPGKMRGAAKKIDQKVDY